MFYILGLICNKCKSNDFKLVKRKRNKEGNTVLYWRCKKTKCASYLSVKRDSYFELHNKKSLMVILQIVKYWCIQIPIIKAFELLKLEDNNTALPLIGLIYKEMRSLCCKSMLNQKIKIDGVGKFVEIDETLCAKVKYNRGSALGIKQVWMFGLVERSLNGRCYLIVVKDRKAETLLAIISDLVESGSTIIHDSLSSYNHIKDLGFSSLSVNHNFNFVDPESGAHTNKIEDI